MMFFEMPFNEWKKKFAYASTEREALDAWRAHGAEKWAAIVKSDHYHGGEACSRVPTCPRFAGAASAPEAAQ
jgi:hypothetical protein